MRDSFCWFCLFSEAFSDLVWIHLLHTSLFFFKLCVFSPSYNGPNQLLVTSLSLSQRWHYSSWLWFVSCPQTLAFLHTLSIYLGWLPALSSGTYTRRWPQSGEAVGLALGNWGFSWVRWGDLWVRFSRQLMGGLPAGLWNTENCIPLMLSDRLNCLFPQHLPAPTHGALLWCSGCCGWGMGFFSGIPTVVVLTGCSLTVLPFPYSRDPQPPLSLSCAALGGKVLLAKFLLPTLMHPNLCIYFATVECWKISFRNLDLY